MTEKTFKALLAYRGQPIPRAHDLEELARLCQQLEPIPELRLQELAEATDYAVQPLRSGDLTFAARGPPSTCTH